MKIVVIACRLYRGTCAEVKSGLDGKRAEGLNYRILRWSKKVCWESVSLSVSKKESRTYFTHFKMTSLPETSRYERNCLHKAPKDCL
jgi:hypothetical protein